MFKLSKDHLTQNIIGLGILAAVALICWPLAPTPNPNPTGILLPNGPLGTPIATSQVQILETMPTHATILGVINTKLHYNSLTLASENADMAASFSYAKTLAAEAGANGVVPTVIGTTGAAGPLDGFVLEANAVRY